MGTFPFLYSTHWLPDSFAIWNIFVHLLLWGMWVISLLYLTFNLFCGSRICLLHIPDRQAKLLFKLCSCECYILCHIAYLFVCILLLECSWFSALSLRVSFCAIAINIIGWDLTLVSFRNLATSFQVKIMWFVKSKKEPKKCLISTQGI